MQLYTEHDVSIVGVGEEGGCLLYRGGIFHEFGVKWQEQHCTNQPYKTSPVGVDILGSDGMHCRASNCLAVHVHSANSADELLPHDFAGPHDPNWESSLGSPVLCYVHPSGKKSVSYVGFKKSKDFTSRIVHRLCFAAYYKALGLEETRSESL